MHLLSIAIMALTSIAHAFVPTKGTGTDTAASMTCTPYLPGPGHSQYMLCQCESAGLITRLPLLPHTQILDGTTTYDEFCGYTAWPSSSTTIPASVVENSPTSMGTSSEISKSLASSSASTTCTANTFTAYPSGLASPYVVCSCNGFEAPLATRGTQTVCAYQPEITVSVPTQKTTEHAVTKFPPYSTSTTGAGVTGAGEMVTVGLGVVIGVGVVGVLCVL